MKLYIVGYMGSGKSRFGSELADILGYDFYDMDFLFEEKFHITINDFFEKYGEDVFRQIEQKILGDTLSLENTVISTGGGTPCFFDNMDVMLANGTCIFLDQDQETVIERLKHMKTKRPLLRNMKDDELEKFIRKHISEREAFYRKAQITIKGSDIDPEKLAKKLKLS